MSNFKPIPDVAFLRSRYDYDPATGRLWSHRTKQPVGKLCTDGYLIVRINKTEFKVARVIWKMVTGRDPVDDVDHVNLNRADNRFGNLRDATRRQNMQNKRVRADSSTGLKGIVRRPARNGRTERFEVWIQVDGQRIYLGSSKSAAEAHILYRKAAARHFRTFAKY